MKSTIPKVLHTIGGRSLVGHALRAARGIGPEHLAVVVRHERDQVAEHVLEHDGDVSTLTQSEDDLGRVTMSAELEPGRSLRLFKLLAYHWSSQQSVDWLRDQVDASLESGLAEGFEGLAEAQQQQAPLQARMQQLVSEFSHTLEALDSVIAARLMQLALEAARQVIGQAPHVDGTALLRQI